MSEQEQKQIAAQALLDRAESKKLLAALGSKARRYADDLRVIADSLHKYTDLPQMPDQDRKFAESIERYPTMEVVKNLYGETKQTKARISELEKQLKGMGYPSD